MSDLLNIQNLEISFQSNNKNKIDNEFRVKFSKILSYIDPLNIVSHLSKMNPKESFLIDKLTCSFFYKREISKKFMYLENIDPIYYLKAKKNNIEIKNMLKSHIYDGVALTKLDVLDGIEVLKICTGYSYGGKKLDHLPSSPKMQAGIVPIYESLVGWSQNTRGARSWAELPEMAVNQVFDKLNAPELQELCILFDSTIDGHTHVPRSHENIRILDRHLIRERIRATSRKPLHHMQGVAVKVSSSVEPGHPIEAGRVNDQRVTLPVAI